MNQAAQIKDTFLILRAATILCLPRLTGKRRTELAIPSIDNFRVERGFLNATFVLEKKREAAVTSKTSARIFKLAIKPSAMLRILSPGPLPQFFLPECSTLWISKT